MRLAGNAGNGMTMDNPKPAENLRMLRKASRHTGIDILSSARVDDECRSRFDESIRDISIGLDNAVVIGIRLSGPVLETVKTAPTWTYYHHYRMVNFALDQAALFIAGECRRNGYRALPIPASQILDWNRLRGHLSHREMAERAGMGWRGRNNLLVNGDFGAQVRLATILTGMPLPVRGISGGPEGCGECRSCISVCPVGAIGEGPEEFGLDRCAAQLRRFSKSEKLNTMICGLCVKVCNGGSGAEGKGTA